MAHVGVLRALLHLGLRPSVLVGVSKGSVVAATYALNPDWYAALRDLDASGFPSLPDFSESGMAALPRKLLRAERMVSRMVLGWSIGEDAARVGARPACGPHHGQKP